MSFSNNLTPAEIERLAILAEEASEVIQVVGKILRHGYDSYHPTTKESNVELLEMELGDLQAAIGLMTSRGDVNHHNIYLNIGKKVDRMQKYLHYAENKN